MLIKAEQKFVRTSPRKLRLVADSVRGIEDPERVLVFLEHLNKRAALPLKKTIKAAVANATNNAKIAGRLCVKEIQIGDGPTYKRFRPVSRGRAHPIQKKTSHIRVILEAKPQEKKSEARKSKSETNNKPKND